MHQFQFGFGGAAPVGLMACAYHRQPLNSFLPYRYSSGYRLTIPGLPPI